MSSRILAPAAGAALLALAALNGAPALAAVDDEVFLCDGFDEGTTCAGVPQSLLDAGMNPEEAEQVETNQVQFAADEPGEADVTFTFVAERGDFDFSFGMCFPDSLPQDVVDAIKEGDATEDEKKAFAISCISGGTHIFDDRAMDAGAMTTEMGISVPAEVVFYLIPDRRREEFLADPDVFYGDDERRPPLFSWADANPGDFDQLVMFTDATNTVFLWEDLQRDRQTDEDFNDLVFDVDVVLIPMEPPIIGDCTTDSCVPVAYDPSNPTTSHTASSDGKCVCISFDCPPTDEGEVGGGSGDDDDDDDDQS